MGIPAPRAPLNKSFIASKISQYWRVNVVDLTTSTQNDLAELVNSSLAKSGDLIAAEFQSAGRGRLDRTFEAPHQSALLFSFYIEPKRNFDDWSFISFLSAIAMQETISSHIDQPATLKWPNDILIGEKKVAGILAQQSANGVIIGIGLNVSMTAEEIPVPIATSLLLEGSKQLDRNYLLAEFLNNFQNKFAQWELGHNFVAEYQKVSATIGREIEVEVPGRESVSGMAKAISPQGALILGDGTAINVGDVVHLR